MKTNSEKAEKARKLSKWDKLIRNTKRERPAFINGKVCWGTNKNQNK